MHHTAIAFVLVVAASLAAAIFDVRTRRIPNVLVVALFAAGLALSAFAGLQNAALDIVITIAVLVVGTGAFSMRLIGGGDIKLVAAACGTLGAPACVVFLLFTFVCGGLIGVAVSFARGRVGETMSNVRGMAVPLFAGVRPMPLQGGMTMPYALAICGGALLTYVTNGALPHVRF